MARGSKVASPLAEPGIYCREPQTRLAAVNNVAKRGVLVAPGGSPEGGGLRSRCAQTRPNTKNGELGKSKRAVINCDRSDNENCPASERLYPTEDEVRECRSAERSLWRQTRVERVMSRGREDGKKMNANRKQIQKGNEERETSGLREAEEGKGGEKRGMDGCSKTYAPTLILSPSPCFRFVSFFILGPIHYFVTDGLLRRHG